MEARLPKSRSCCARLPVLDREQEVRPCPAEICAEGVGSTAAPGSRILTLAACPQVLHLCALCLYGVRGRESQ